MFDLLGSVVFNFFFPSIDEPQFLLVGKVFDESEIFIKLGILWEWFDLFFIFYVLNMRDLF